MGVYAKHLSAFQKLCRKIVGGELGFSLLKLLIFIQNGTMGAKLSFVPIEQNVRDKMSDGTSGFGNRAGKKWEGEGERRGFWNGGGVSRDSKKREGVAEREEGGGANPFDCPANLPYSALFIGPDFSPRRFGKIKIPSERAAEELANSKNAGRIRRP
jgi:hypothetical protein